MSSTKTPKKKGKKKSDSSFSEKSSADDPQLGQFSPVTVTPTRSPLKGNLTGLARKVKDSVADWHNVIQKWEVKNTKGTNIVNRIANIKLGTVADPDDPPSDMMPSTMTDELGKMVEELEEVVIAMKKILDKMSSLSSSLKGVCDLEWHQNNQAWSAEPLFQTWPTNRFHEVSEELLLMYQQEFKLKDQLYQNIAHTTDRNVMMFYTSAWLHEPYIEDNKTLLLESMLLETGHR